MFIVMIVSFLWRALFIVFLIIFHQPQSLTETVSEKDLGDTITAKNRFVSSYELIMKKAKTPGYSAYIGCFKMTPDWRDNFVKAIPHMLVSDVKKCIEACWEERNRFALLKEGRTCSCTETLRDVSKTGSSHCSSPCLGNNKQACGAPAHLSVYYTGYLEEPQFTTFTLALGQKRYIGCYRTRDENVCHFSFNTHRMRAAMCMDICEEYGYLYAALFSMMKCCCTNKLSKQRAALCHAICKGSSPKTKEFCGSYSPNYYSVYRTGLLEEASDYKRLNYDQVWMHPNVNESDIQEL